MALLFDSHAHLQNAKFNADREEVIVRARQAGVGRILNLGTRLEDAPDVIDLARQHPDLCLAAIGVHPCDADDWCEKTEKGLIELAAADEVVVWGEIGLDYYHPGYVVEDQRCIFRRQLAIARELQLPVSMHCRGEAYDDLIECLRAENASAIGGVSHCFAGEARHATQLVEMGFALGVGGIVTYPKSGDLRAILKGVGIEHLILETDSPYLAPQPQRGKRNEPAFVAHTADVLASTLEMDVEELKNRCWNNTTQVFGLNQ